MSRWWWVFVLAFSLVRSDEAADACMAEIKKIDAQILKLHDEKQKYVDLAKKYQAEGDRWQYTTGRVDYAYENWGKADDARAKAIALQLQIDYLYEKKNRIYQFYPQLEYE